VRFLRAFGFGFKDAGLGREVLFAETGLVITPFLPGDSLLFTIGILANQGSLSIWIVVPTLIAAAFIGDNLNYQIGSRFGQKAFDRGDSRFIKRQHIEKTQRFFDKHGGWALVLARWVPIVRTFMPFVAGMGAMKFPAFLFWSAIGATIWGVGRAQRYSRGRPAPGGPGSADPPPRAAPEDFFSWEEPPAGPSRSGQRPDDIEGTGHEVDDENELPPGREPFGG
jgi:membrane protein YqaA with SNARE-associated domain